MSLASYFIHLGILLSVYLILALAFQLSVGYTGMLNLGHIAFFGIGAYVSALLTLKLGFQIWIGLIAAFLITAVFGAIIAIPTKNIKGDYFALVTLGFAFIMDAVARNWIGLTEGALGLKGIPKIFHSNLHIMLFGFALVLLTYVAMTRVLNTNAGKVFRAIRDDELAALTLGKNTHAHKILSLSISAAFAGLAGGFFAHYITFIDPSIFDLGDVILMLAMVIVGGLGSLHGTLIGTALIFLIPEPLRFIGFPPSLIGPVREILFALVLLLILIYKPKGFFGKVDLG